MSTNDLPEPTIVLQSQKPFTLALGTKSKAPKSTLVKGKKRPHSVLTEDFDSDNESQNTTHELVTTFDRSAGGAIGAHTERAKAPLVIANQKNRDWRVEAGRKRSRNLLPEEEQARRNRVANNAGIDESEKGEHQSKFGLVVPEQKTADEVEKTSMNGVHTADDEAMGALLGHDHQSNLVITMGEDDFRFDVASRPDPASLADYTAVPIEEFGAAMLRGMLHRGFSEVGTKYCVGMGWKEGEAVGRNKKGSTKPRLLERRPALLGIGAKGVPEELGAWGKGLNKTNKIDRNYAPVALKNAKTGEVLTEEELAARKKREKLVEDDGRERKGKQITDGGEGRSPKHKHRSRNDDDSYENDKRHDRHRSKERRRRREKDRGRDRDSDRRREYDYNDGRWDDRERDRDRYRDRPRHSERH